MKSRFTLQEADLEKAQKMQAKKDDDPAGDLGKEIGVARDQLAHHGGRGAERDEHHGETQDEHDSSQQHPALSLVIDRLVVGELFECDASDEAEIGRHQREHAGAEEAQEACKQRSGIGDVETRHSIKYRRSRPCRDGVAFNVP